MSFQLELKTLDKKAEEEILSRADLNLEQKRACAIYGGSLRPHTEEKVKLFDLTLLIEEFIRALKAGLPPFLAVVAINLFFTAMSEMIDGGESSRANLELDITVRVCISGMAAMLVVAFRQCILETMELGRR